LFASILYEDRTYSRTKHFLYEFYSTCVHLNLNKPNNGHRPGVGSVQCGDSSQILDMAEQVISVSYSKQVEEGTPGQEKQLVP
jgi:hypothetical protein